MEIRIIGADRLERLSAMLVVLGGDPFLIAPHYPGRGMPTPYDWKDKRATWLVYEIAELMEQVETARYWLAGGLCDRFGIPYSDFNAEAVEAFRKGESYYPPHYERGLGAGNYVSDLWSDGKTLFLVKRVNDGSYRTWNQPLAEAV